MKKIHGLLLVGSSALALISCGPGDISAPGTGGDVIINPQPSPSPSPSPTGGGSVTPAAGCPTVADPQGLTDVGTISGPTGEYRVCRLPSLIRTSMTLPKVDGLLYQMNGRVNVGCDGGFSAPTASFNSSTPGCDSPLTADTNVTLTIQPGVILYGNTGQTWLAVNRGNKINAAGTSADPIIFTSRDNVLGLTTEDSQGQWGGVVLMGRAPITDCTTGSVASGTCERQTEGAADPARFGGADSTYNAGTLRYVQVRYSGFVLGANSELQSLTGEGIGTGTTIEYFMSYNSSDDGSEFFGGSPRVKHYISVGADDDSLDVDTGAQMDVQYALLLQRDGKGDALFEIDSNGNEADTPRTKLRVANFTGIQRQVSSNNEGNDQASALFRGNLDMTLINGIIATPQNECIRMNGSGDNPATLTARSVVLQCAAQQFIGTGSYTASQVAGFFNAGTNNNASFTPTLSSLFINGANENGVVVTDAKTISSYFDTTDYIGAVKNSSDNWYAGWTCNSGAANFGSGNSGSCATLPTA